MLLSTLPNTILNSVRFPLLYTSCDKFAFFEKLLNCSLASPAKPSVQRGLRNELLSLLSLEFATYGISVQLALAWQNIPNAFICTMCSWLTVFIVSSTDYLETYENGLVNVVNAKQSILAQEILNGYLSRNAAAATKREWCEVATDASSYSENK